MSFDVLLKMSKFIKIRQHRFNVSTLNIIISCDRRRRPEKFDIEQRSANVSAVDEKAHPKSIVTTMSALKKEKKWAARLLKNFIHRKCVWSWLKSVNSLDLFFNRRSADVFNQANVEFFFFPFFSAFVACFGASRVWDNTTYIEIQSIELTKYRLFID